MEHVEHLEHIRHGRKEPADLPFALLKNITDNFSEEQEIGQGGFAIVYKGVLPNGIVAVKRIKSGHSINPNLFHRELKSLLTVNHENVVRFLGFCASTNETAIKVDGSKEHIFAEVRERLLCFEYVSNGSLQDYITDELRGLEWDTRYGIIRGICEGLYHLHNEKQMFHMDLKPGNVLLDSRMVPKIADFGLSRLDGKSETMTQGRLGTPGYCDPEFLLFGKMSFKSDIYSLGTIIIELVTGHRSIPNNNINNVLRRWRHRWKVSGMEKPLAYYQVSKCIEIGLLCQDIKPSKRPFIWDMINKIREMEGVNGEIRNFHDYTFGEISPYSKDDMVGIEPLDLHLPFELNKQMSNSFQLTNETEYYIAFNVQNMSPLPYCIEPQKGIVPPRSKCNVSITLQPQDKAPLCASEFIVQSIKVNYNISAEDITTAMFSIDTDNVVDEVTLDVFFVQRIQTGSGSIVQKGSQVSGDIEQKRLLRILSVPQVSENSSSQQVPSSNRDTVAKGWQKNIYPTYLQGSQVNGDKEEKRLLRILSVSQVAENSSSQQVPSSNREAVVREWQENYPLVGRESEMNELRDYTARARFSNNSQQVISVWGIAGSGKSALVRSLYYDRMLGTNQFNKYSWVDVSRPLNLRDFSRSLLSDFGSEKDPIKECRELLKQHNCLVVIDDLHYKEEWDIIQNALVSRTSGSVIIVITTAASVAAYCTNNEAQMFNVKALEADAALDLFRKEVRRENPSSPLHHLSHLELDELILKCGGLPKVIVSISASLATETVTLMDTVRSLNQKFMHHLQTNPEYDSFRGLFDWIYNYFSTCPDSLKSCIFYLSFFPRGHPIRRRRLVRRWIAEGYTRDSGEESAVDEGKNFFSKLLDLTIIQQIPQLVINDSSMISFQVNGFIHEYLISRRTEENLVLELGPTCILATHRVGRHLIILRDWARDKIVFECIDFSDLLSLTVLGSWESFFISKNMMQLLVLDLEDALGVKDDDLEKMLKLLRGLKFLSLRGCSDILHLPSSLGNLMQLQTLDVRHTSITTLPANITKLQKLQHIRVGNTQPASTSSASSSWVPEFLKLRGLVGVKVPRGISKLTALHTLGVINVDASGGKNIVKEIKKLTQLRKLGVSGINRRNYKYFFAIPGHVHLESLLIQLDKDSEGCLDDISLPWENLQSLKLYGLHDKLPLSGSNISKLGKLDLEMVTLEKSDIEFLGSKLLKLCILRLCVQQLQADKLHFYAELDGYEMVTFEKVKILEIACSSSKVSQVVFGSKSMKNLELLKLDCSSASYHLNGLNYLTELKQVLLKGADEQIKTYFEKQLLETHPKKPPTVKLE